MLHQKNTGNTEKEDKSLTLKYNHTNTNNFTNNTLNKNGNTIIDITKESIKHNNSVASLAEIDNIDFVFNSSKCDNIFTSNKSLIVSNNQI